MGRSCALGERLGGVRPILGVRNGNPHRDLLDQRDRVFERTIQERGEGTGPFPLRKLASKCLCLVTRSLDPTVSRPPLINVLERDARIIGAKVRGVGATP